MKKNIYSNKIAIIIALLGNIIQHFEYALFGFSSAIITQTFFPPSDFLTQIIRFYQLLLISIIFRPIGSYIFGKIGDKYGRAKSFRLGMIISSISTILIGLIPTFNEFGYLSLILVIICRISLIMTGQIDNVTIYITENISQKHQNFASGLISLSLQFGIFIASLTYTIAYNSEISYLWRINFIASGILGIIIISLRKFIIETNEYEQYISKTKKSNTDTNIISIIYNNKFHFIKSIAIHGGIGGIYNFFILFFNNYTGHIIKIASIYKINKASSIGIALCSLLAPISGILADKFNVKKQIYYSLILYFLIAITNIIFFSYNIYIEELHILLLAIYPFFTVPLIIYLKKLFSVEVRMRLYSLSHTIGSSILSTTTPLICTILWKYTQNPISPLLYFLFLNILLIISIHY